MPSLFQIVTNTPLWVWPLMAFVLWLGVQGLRPRVIPWWRLAILPMVGLATSLGGIAQSANPVWAATGWALALLAFLPLGWAFGQNRPVRLRPEDGRLEIAGGWFALAFGVSIFAVRYAMGVLFGVLPALRGEAFWISPVGRGRRHGRRHRHRLARQPAAPRPPLDGGCTMRLIALLVLALSTSLATSLAVLAQQRFDFKVREDMFAGMDGDTAAFDRAMKLIADTLAADPDHAEALVWRGDGRLFLAGQAFQRGAIAEGQALTGARNSGYGSRRGPGAGQHRGPRPARRRSAAVRARHAAVQSPRSGSTDENGHRRLRVRGGGQHALVEQAD